MAIGEAIALGIAQGVGTGMQQHFQDNRRERMDLRRMDKSFDMFKKQSQFSFGLQNIGKQNEVLGKWEEAAKLGVNDLAFQAATKMAEPFSKEDRPKVIRDSMKNFQGMSKAELLSRAGYNKPDYSTYIDNPDYQDAIPRARIAGMAEAPDMEATFKYDPRQFAEEQKKEGEQITDYMRKKKDEFSAIQSMAVVSFGAKPSEELSNFIWKNRPSGTAAELKGADVVSYDQNLLTSMINSGQVIQVGSQLKLRGELSEEDKDVLGIQPAPTQKPTGTLYTEPTTEAYLTEQEEKAETKRIRQEAKTVEKDQGKTIKSYTSLLDLEQQLAGLSPDAKEILFGAATLKGALSMTDIGRKIAAKADVPGAQEARKFLALMENISATLKHEQYGSAQTATELKNFADQLGNPGILQNPETLLEQIKTRQELIGASLDASVGADGREGYLSQHPDSPLAARWGTPEEDTNQTVSDSSAPRITDAQGQDMSSQIPKEFWTASPEKQQQFLKQYNLTMGN